MVGPDGGGLDGGRLGGGLDGGGLGGGLDCQGCGACCKNLPSNRAQGFAYWVEIGPGDRLLTRADLVRKHVTRDPEGVAHLRLAHDGRCLALRGTVGDRVSCAIYRDRPAPCRRVEPGDASCLRARAEHGLSARQAG